MSKTHPRKPQGHSVTDADGNRKWTWHTEDVDTKTVRALGEDLSLDTPDEKPGNGLNPYDQTRPVTPPQPPPGSPEAAAPRRRTLDDMRRLSEQIKQTKHWNRDK